MEWIIINIVESILLTWFLTSLVHVKRKKELYCFLVCILNLTMITLSNYLNMYDIFLTSFLIICNVFLSYLFVEESLYELFFICCLENVFNSFTIILSVMINYMFHLDIIDPLGKIIYFILALLLIKYLKNKISFYNQNIYLVIGVILFGLHFIMQNLLQVYLILKVEIPELIILFVMLFCCVIGLLIILSKVAQMNKEQQEYQKLKQDKKNEEALLYLYEQLKITKHDLKHDYQLFQYYINKKDYNKVQELISSKKDIVDSVPTLISTHNKLLNTIINGKILEAYSKNITVESVISIDEIDFIHDYDLNTLLSNLLDNAIENNNEGIIRINIVQDNVLLHIKVCNTVNPQKYSPELITQKDIQNHGFGLKSINRIVKKYQGVINLIHNQSEFEIQITLLMQ